MKKITLVLGFMVTLMLTTTCMGGFWDPVPAVTKSQSGLTMQSVQLSPVKDGMSLEQFNIYQRYLHDNKVDALKFVYVIGSNGQVCMNYQILGKVTSSGKRLTPRTVAAYGSGGYEQSGISVTIAGRNYQTTEVIEDDGTYGDSMPYYYMWTTAGNYIQVIPTGMFLTVIADKQLTPTELVFSSTTVKN
jgi:hypothetical protein